MKLTIMRSSAVLLALCGAGLAHAESVIYKCVDDSGRVEFTDQNRRGCKILDVPGSIPAPARAAGGARAPVLTPGAFPRVDSAQQKARDNDRREILHEELRNEERKLAELRRDYNGGEPERQGNEKNYAKYQARVADMKDSIGRTERNIDALRREIDSIR